MKASGERAVLRVGYQTAVELRGWRMEGDKDTLGAPRFAVTAKVHRINSFWVTQLPMDLGLYLGDSVWWMWEKAQPPHHRDIKPGATIEISIDGVPIIVPRF